MNPTYQVNQVGESQPDADDSTVPISNWRHTVSPLFAKRSASWKVGTVTVTKQGDQSRLYTNLRREVLERANQAVLSQQVVVNTSKPASDKVWEFANDAQTICLVPAAWPGTSIVHVSVGVASDQT